MDIKEKILKAREERSILKSNYLKDFKTVISVRANLPGEDKNHYLSFLLLHAFAFLANDLNGQIIKYYDNADGPFLIILTNEEASKIKNKTIIIEENHILGRFIDIDVHHKDGAISRDESRKCIICGKEVYDCMRSNKHHLQDLFKIIEEAVIKYYQENLSEIIDESILAELDLTPKFGLVTPKDSGSHLDMDYNLMIKAKNAIIPYFIEMFILTVKSKEYLSLIPRLQEIGLSAEKAMLDVTNEVNCYKGLIFNLGLIISAWAYKISRFNRANIYEISADFAKIIWSDYQFDTDSFGDKAYQKYQMLGIKGEALSGFKHVRKGMKYLVDLSDTSRLKALVYFIGNIEDTNLLKRAKNFETYQNVKKRFLKLDIINKKELLKLNDYCIQKSLSFGGSADLLVVSVFLKKIESFSLDF